jgi:hypothetical protein
MDFYYRAKVIKNKILMKIKNYLKKKIARIIFNKKIRI